MNTTRRNFLYFSSLLTGGMLLRPQRSLLSPFLLPPGTMQELRGNVGIFTERGGTIAWYIDGNGIVVVDTQFPEQSAHLLEHLHARSEASIEAVFNTHHHGDHSSGNIAFKGIAKQVIAHGNSRKNQEKAAIAAKTEAKQLYPDVTFSQGHQIKVGSESISATYFGAGHTNGDTVIHFENANIVHMGDLIFNRRFPYIDKANGAQIENWISVLGKIAKHYEKDTQYIFGHAGEGYEVTGTNKDLKAMQNYLSQLLKLTKKQIQAGKTLEETISTVKVIPKAPEWKGDGIERGIRAAYEELKK